MTRVYSIREVYPRAFYISVDVFDKGSFACSLNARIVNDCVLHLDCSSVAHFPLVQLSHEVSSFLSRVDGVLRERYSVNDLNKMDSSLF